MIDIEALREINYIIEHDSTSSTYKYALLKSVINATQKYEHLIRLEKNKAFIPLGIIIQEWIIDYMPFVFKEISQQNNKVVLNKQIQLYYENIFDILKLDKSQNWEYAYKQFIQAFKYEIIDYELSDQFFKLSKEIAKTITNMPMKYTGKSEYSFFEPDNIKFAHIKIGKKQTYDISYLTSFFGEFSITKNHYEIFRYLGQTLYGTSTIISKWKDKTLSLNENTKILDDIDKILTNPFDDRDTSKSRRIFSGKQRCVWSGNLIDEKDIDIDHLLPFSVWVNNDFWNLLPTERTLNQKHKKDKIPSRKLIEKQADLIVEYWKIYEEKLPQLFLSQLSISLTGKDIYENNYDFAIESLCKKSDYLIADRGYQKFEII